MLPLTIVRLSSRPPLPILSRSRPDCSGQRSCGRDRALLDRGANPNAYFMTGNSRYTPLVGVIGEGEEDRPLTRYVRRSRSCCSTAAPTRSTCSEIQLRVLSHRGLTGDEPL